PDNRRLLAYLLRAMGAKVDVAENGRRAVIAALEADANGAPHDLILMDMQMPLQNGYEATAELRGRGHRGPIVALTAYVLDSEREEVFAAGCDELANKPIDQPTLESLLKKYAR